MTKEKLLFYIYPPVRQDIRWHRVMKVVGWFLSVASLIYFPIAFILYFGVIQRAILHIVYGKDKSKWFVKNNSDISIKNEVNYERKKKAEESRNKILDLFDGKEEMTNNDVEEFLKVSDSTATRYLDELEKEGKIVQIGRQGRFVKYRLK